VPKEDQPVEEAGVASPSASSRGEPSPPRSLADVWSFSQMVRLAPQLHSKAPRMQASELAALCEAAARVKFFDAALFEVVTQALRKNLDRPNAGGLGAEELTTVVAGLADLNVYDKDLFSKAARALAAGGAAERLDAGRRRQLLESFRAVKHKGDEAFLEALSQRVRSEKYEEAKDALWRRNITKMYGETVDLQGWSVDTERAMLKRPRHQTTRERG